MGTLLIAIVVITLIDALVLYVLLPAMIADHDMVPPPPVGDCVIYSAIANGVSLALRMAGIRAPVHFLYYGNLFWNKFGLNSIAVGLCLVAMAIPEFALVFVLTMADKAR